MQLASFSRILSYPVKDKTIQTNELAKLEKQAFPCLVNRLLIVNYKQNSDLAAAGKPKSIASPCEFSIFQMQESM